MGSSWQSALSSEFSKPYFKQVFLFFPLVLPQFKKKNLKSYSNLVFLPQVPPDCIDFNVDLKMFLGRWGGRERDFLLASIPMSGITRNII